MVADMTEKPVVKGFWDAGPIIVVQWTAYYSTAYQFAE